MILNALIVDDERIAAKTMQLMLEQYVDDVHVVDIAHSAAQALQILAENPTIDVVFLDIEMPGGSGFDLLEQCPNRQFEVIFATAYEAYAIRAFKHSAIDYLLKPIDAEELQQAVAHVVRIKSTNFDSRQRYNALFDNIKAMLPQKLVVSMGNRSECLDLPRVLYLEQQEKSTLVSFSDGQKAQIDNRLADLLCIMGDRRFLKIDTHRAVNSSRIAQIGRNTLRLDTGIELPVGSEYRAAIIDFLDPPTPTR